jgi:hypothetical protein
MEMDSKPVIMVTPVDGAWTWKFVERGDHGLVSDSDGRAATHDEAVAAGLNAHPDASVVEVENPDASY